MPVVVALDEEEVPDVDNKTADALAVELVDEDDEETSREESVNIELPILALISSFFNPVGLELT